MKCNTKENFMKLYILFIIMFSVSTNIMAEVNVFGPGGPAPAMVAVAKLYTTKTGVKVNIIAGPTDKWATNAQSQGDLVFSGSEIMLDDFTSQFNLKNSKALYLRPSVILVRKGNPKNIKGIKSLFQKGMNIMVVQGAGQVGLWEDIVGRTKDINKINIFRENMVFIAKNSAVAVAEWKNRPTIDAWIIWNHWYDRTQDVTDMVEIESEYRIYRATSIAFTEKGVTNQDSKGFYDFLDSKEAQAIFKKNGWQKQWNLFSWLAIF